MSHPEPLIARYRLALDVSEDARDRALRLAHEQSVEMPPGTVAPDAPLLAQVLAVEPLDPGDRDETQLADATIAYDPDIAGADLGQLLVALFGNVSLQRGVRLIDVTWPARLVAAFSGPGYGIAGLRALCGVASERPLLCGVAKPLGASTPELARACAAIARGGADLIKDDHGIADPPTSPFGERIARCQEAVEAANRATGGACRYAPNLAGPLATLPTRVERARALGIRVALVPPLALGLETVRELARTSGLALLGHPALAGAFFAPDHGIAPPILLGDLYRLAGCDAVIYPHAGGRFPFSADDVAGLAHRLRTPWGAIRPAFPIAAGGVAIERVAAMRRELGADAIFLLGTSLYLEARRTDGLERATARLAALVREES